jgi:hypothetical protein
MRARRILTCVLAFTAAATVGACHWSQECTLVGCPDGPMFTVHLHRTASVLDATITYCRNGACTSYRSSASSTGSSLQVTSEGDGWSLVTLPRTLIFDQQDGDRYAVRVVGADGSVYLDVERSITYERSFPNGERCGGACLVASSAFYETSQSGLACSARPSVSKAEFSFALDDVVARRSAFTLCRNDVCGTVTPTGFPSEASGGALAVQVTGLGPPGREQLIVSATGESAVLRDGDRYRLTVVDATTNAVVERFDGPLTYQTSFPNGEACDVYPSRQAHVTLD